MLQELRIQDFAIVDQLELRLQAGFVVLTGETGAGKSILIDAVELILGGRAATSAVRTGAERAVLEATFHLEAAVRPQAHALLQREELLDHPELVTLGREIRAEGRTVCRINGRTVTLALLRELGALLVDVHGQSEHLSLLRQQDQRDLLDRYAGALGERERYAALYARLRQVRRELEALRQGEREAARRADLLAYQIDEIEGAQLQPGEEEELATERARLANAERLAALAEEAIAALDEGLEGQLPAIDLLGQAAHALGKLAEVDATGGPFAETAQALMEQVGELVHQLRAYRDSIEFNPQRLEEVEGRLALIHDLQRKYAPDIPGILAFCQQAKEELESIVHADQRMAALEAQQEQLLQELAAQAGRLAELRRRGSQALAVAIERELAGLRMGGAQFAVDLRWEEDPEGLPLEGRRLAFGPAGLERVEFLVAPNPGEGLKPLAKIASGGETSRLMLALKGVLAQADRVPTLIFDEIDQGIGGRMGALVGQKLWRLARSHQVICITHLPQLAAYADQHLRVEKALKEGRTVVRVVPLAEDQRCQELAVMLGGETESNLRSATELLASARASKEGMPTAQPS